MQQRFALDLHQSDYLSNTRPAVGHLPPQLKSSASPAMAEEDCVDSCSCHHTSMSPTQTTRIAGALCELFASLRKPVKHQAKPTTSRHHLLASNHFKFTSLCWPLFLPQALHETNAERPDTLLGFRFTLWLG